MIYINSTEIQDAVLFAVRDGNFSEFVDNNGYTEEQKLDAIKQLLQQGNIEILKLTSKQTVRGEGFVMQDLKLMPEQVRLTLQGERAVDKKLGISSKELEAKGIDTILRALVNRPVEDFFNLKMPEGIGHNRRRHLQQELFNRKMFELVRDSVKQGFFTISKDVAKITPAGAMEFAKANTNPDDLKEMFKNAQRQLLLKLLVEKIDVSDEYKNIKTELLGWGAELFDAVMQPLLDAKIIVKEKQSVFGRFKSSVDVFALTNKQPVQASAKHPAAKMTISNLSSGEQIAAAIFKYPEVSIEVSIPSRITGQKPTILAL